MKTPATLLVLLALPLGACVMADPNPKETPAGDPSLAAAAPAPTAAAPSATTASDEPAAGGISSHYKPTEGGSRNPVTELLRKAQTELSAEQEARKRAETELAETRARLEETRNALSTARLEADASKTSRDVITTQLRDLSEKLVTSALARAEAERDALEAKIALEKAVRVAAEKGVIVDGFENKEVAMVAPPASRPAKDAKTAADAKPAHGDAKPAAGDAKPAGKESKQ